MHSLPTADGGTHSADEENLLLLRLANHFTLLDRIDECWHIEVNTIEVAQNKLNKLRIVDIRISLEEIMPVEGAK